MRWLLSYLVAVMLVVVLAPIILAVAIIILMCDGKPVFFMSPRMGRAGQPFSMVKFRTMRPLRNGESSHLITTSYEVRVTPLGSWLRRWRIDEIPQLFNVLRGDMMIVGPRPESPAYAAHYGIQRDDMHRLWPGVTDPGTLAYLFEETELVSSGNDPSDVYVHQVMPRRNSISIDYGHRATVFSDALVMLGTLVALISPRVAKRVSLILLNMKRSSSTTASKQ